MDRRPVAIGLVTSVAIAVAFVVGAVARETPTVTALATPKGGDVSIDWSLSPAQITATCRSAIQIANERLAQIVADPSAATFVSVLLPLENAIADLNDDTAAQQFLENVSVDKDVRVASQDCSSAEAAFLIDVSARPALFAKLKAAKASRTAFGAAQEKLTDLWLALAVHAGSGLPDDKRLEFVKLSANLSFLENQFEANLGNDASVITISATQTAGLPDEFVKSLERRGSTYIVPVNESTDVFLRTEADEAARREYFMAFENRGGEVNVALLEQAIAIRSKLAHLLGYANWAQYALADKMAETPQRVDAFLAGIDRAILPKARSERAELAALKGGSSFAYWDIPFYKARLQRERYSVDQQAIAKYFPVQHTVDAVMHVYAKLFDVTFMPIAQPHIYNREVTGYEVHDGSSGKMLGQFYLDLYPRPGKFDHFANFPLVYRRVMSDGSERTPISVIVGNWPRPAAGQPGFLTHPEVQTFFHEFGHNMAAMLANEPYATLTSGFRSDFIEAPSQMLENWAWDPSVLKEISSNVVTGKPLPQDTVAKMIAARFVDYALSTTQQILYSQVDMTYHSTEPPVDTTAIWARTVPEVTPNVYVTGTHSQGSFGHLMSGYDAGYYGYLWSKVYAQDMFSAFKVMGLENPAVGKRYRHDILAPGRTYEPDVEVAAFLGRPVNPAEFYSELQIVPPPLSSR